MRHATLLLVLACGVAGDAIYHYHTVAKGIEATPDTTSLYMIYPDQCTAYIPSSYRKCPDSLIVKLRTRSHEHISITLSDDLETIQIYRDTCKGEVLVRIWEKCEGGQPSLLELSPRLATLPSLPGITYLNRKNM